MKYVLALAAAGITAAIIYKTRHHANEAAARAAAAARVRAAFAAQAAAQAAEDTANAMSAAKTADEEAERTFNAMNYLSNAAKNAQQESFDEQFKKIGVTAHFNVASFKDKKADHVTKLLMEEKAILKKGLFPNFFSRNRLEEIRKELQGQTVHANKNEVEKLRGEHTKAAQAYETKNEAAQAATAAATAEAAVVVNAKKAQINANKLVKSLNFKEKVANSRLKAALNEAKKT